MDFFMKCPLCHSEKLNELGINPDFLTPSYNCSSCSLVFTSSPGSENIFKFYNKHYRAKENLELENKKLLAYTRGCSQVKFTIETLGIEDQFNDLDILEYGAGMGPVTRAVFLERNKRIDLLEPSQSLTKLWRENGFNVYQSQEELNKSQKKYDLIFLSHVLEHVENPGEFLLEILSALKLNGHLYIEVPHEDLRIVNAMIDSSIFGLGHLYHFNKTSFEKTLQTIDGIEVDQVYHYGITIEEFLNDKFIGFGFDLYDNKDAIWLRAIIKKTKEINSLSQQMIPAEVNLSSEEVYDRYLKVFQDIELHRKSDKRNLEKQLRLSLKQEEKITKLSTEKETLIKQKEEMKKQHDYMRSKYHKIKRNFVFRIYNFIKKIIKKLLFKS